VRWPTTLCCSGSWRVAELASFAALTALRQPRRVRSRSALRAPTPLLRFSSPHKSPPADAACREGHRGGMRPEHLRGEVARRYAVSVGVASRKPKAESRKPLPSCHHEHAPLRSAAAWTESRTHALSASREPMPCPQRRAPGSPRRALRGAEERRTRGRARSALRDPTRRGCSSAVSPANAASSATGHAAEYRRAVGAQRRPPR
jgi:hypothetical protein